ncbi:hypothetical protein EYV94_10330 [Puteibacter caeruleilacunae]|nr:hypothetical protein EYV94_10330 [Puteibacter caeruleilacunae]
MNSTNTKTIGADKFSEIIEKEFHKRTQTIIKVIHQNLDKKGWSVQQLANILGEPPTNLYRCLSGSNDLSLSNIAKFEIALGINLTNCKQTPSIPSGYLDTSAKQKIAYGLKKFKKTHDMNNLLEHRWLTWYNEMVHFVNKNGHAKIPVKKKFEDPLYGWIKRNRKYYRNGTLDSNKEELLQVLGINLGLTRAETSWNNMYTRLEKYKAEMGTVHVVSTDQTKDLYHWLHNQQYKYREGELDIKKVMRLKQLGVKMQPKTLNSWEQKFIQLVEFKEKHGDLFIGRAYGASPQLIGFVASQRRAKNTMSKERKELLNRIGFIWEPDPTFHAKMVKKKALEHWLERYADLKAFKGKYGTSYISLKNERYKSLAIWIRTQKHERDKLGPEKIKLLKKIDFFKDNGMEKKPNVE